MGIKITDERVHDSQKSQELAGNAKEEAEGKDNELASAPFIQKVES